MKGCRPHQVGLGFWIAAMLLLSAAASPPPPSEYKVKAAFLYNFGKFVEWPEPLSKDEDFIIGVLGNNPFNRELTALEGRKINHHQIKIRCFTDVKEARTCRVLFISYKEADRWNEILSATSSNPILTVSDMDHFAEKGGMIHLMLSGDHVRFEINTEIAQRAKLRISSQLLKLALRVYPKPLE